MYCPCYSLVSKVLRILPDLGILVSTFWIVTARLKDADTPVTVAPPVLRLVNLYSNAKSAGA